MPAGISTATTGILGVLQPAGWCRFHGAGQERVTFCNPDNWFEQEVSGEVAGIIVTALVLNHRSFYHSHHDNDELCAHFCHRFSALMAFIETHPDAAVIQRAGLTESQRAALPPRRR
jgi:hypothetical protein